MAMALNWAADFTVVLVSVMLIAAMFSEAGDVRARR